MNLELTDILWYLSIGVFFFLMVRRGGCCGGHHHEKKKQNSNAITGEEYK